MAGQIDSEERRIHEQMLMRLVSWLYTTCMEHLGRLADADTGRVCVDLPAAQTSIEMLRMLRSKTRGNLAPGEEETIRAALSGMESGYADEMKKAAAAGEAASGIPAGRALGGTSRPGGGRNGSGGNGAGAN